MIVVGHMEEPGVGGCGAAEDRLVPEVRAVHLLQPAQQRPEHRERQEPAGQREPNAEAQAMRLERLGDFGNTEGCESENRIVVQGLRGEQAQAHENHPAGLTRTLVADESERDAGNEQFVRSGI